MIATPFRPWAEIGREIRSRPGLLRVVRTIRFIALVGPWRPLLVAYHRFSNRNRLAWPTGPSLLPYTDIDAAAESLHHRGFARLGVIPRESIDQVKAFAADGSARVFRNPHLMCEEIRKIAQDPVLAGVARQYLGAEPILYASNMWWSDPPTGSLASHAFKFHFDVADCKSLVVFVYLTDVNDSSNGPHVVIEGTHEHKSFADLLRIHMSDAVAEKRFGDRIHTILGEAGTVFMEEQTIFHKASIPQRSRLILGINYTLNRKCGSDVRPRSIEMLPAN